MVRVERRLLKEVQDSSRGWVSGAKSCYLSKTPELLLKDCIKKAMKGRAGTHAVGTAIPSAKPKETVRFCLHPAACATSQLSLTLSLDFSEITSFGLYNVCPTQPNTSNSAGRFTVCVSQSKTTRTNRLETTSQRTHQRWDGCTEGVAKSYLCAGTPAAS